MILLHNDRVKWKEKLKICCELLFITSGNGVGVPLRARSDLLETINHSAERTQGKSPEQECSEPPAPEH